MRGPDPRLVALIAVSLAVPAHLVAWEAKSFGERGHVRVGEAASFYGLGNETSAGVDSKKFVGPGRDLVVTKNSRLISVNGVAHWIAFPVVEEGGEFFLSRLDLEKTLEPAFRPALIPDFPAVTTVVLDPGHGGHDNGARGPHDVEKNFSLDVARRVRDELKKSGMRVLLTRNTDSCIELPDRAAVANRQKNAIFVSLHFNSADWNRDARGFEVFCMTPRGAPSTGYEKVRASDMTKENGNQHDLHSFALANTIFHALHGRLEMTDRGVKRARFAVLRLAGVPSVLIEGGFLTNTTDARKIASKAWRDAYASAIACGILEYKKLAEQKTPPRLLADYRHPLNSPAPVAAAIPPR